MNLDQENRLRRQMEFIVEMDRLKTIYRQTLIRDKSRYENDAEHSWHLAMMALILNEHAKEPVDVCRVLKMVLTHDIVEIDAGDTFAYDVAGNETKAARENAAAERLFGMLPPEQAAEIRALWDEFESQETPEARFATSLDRLAGLLNNYYTDGHGWKKHGVTVDRILARNGHIANGSPTLWEYAKHLIDDAVSRGVL